MLGGGQERGVCALLVCAVVSVSHTPPPFPQLASSRFFFIRESPASGAVSFHVILHNTPRGIHLWSADGLNFTLQQALDTRGEPLAPFVFDERVVQTDGTAFNASRRERPWLLFAEGTRSTPEVLVTSMEASSAFSRVFTHAQGVRRAAVVVQPPPETWILA